MRFVRLLRPELIVLDPPWQGFRNTVAGMVAHLVAAGALDATHASDAERAIHQREAEASTAAIDIDVGMPHARIGGLRDSVVALAIAPDGLYEPIPTVPIRIVAMVLSPTAATDDHLRLLASIATLLRSPQLRTTLLEATGPDAVLAALGHHDRSAP